MDSWISFVYSDKACWRSLEYTLYTKILCIVPTRATMALNMQGKRIRFFHEKKFN